MELEMSKSVPRQIRRFVFPSFATQHDARSVFCCALLVQYWPLKVSIKVRVLNVAIFVVIIDSFRFSTEKIVCESRLNDSSALTQHAAAQQETRIRLTNFNEVFSGPDVMYLKVQNWRRDISICWVSISSCCNLYFRFYNTHRSMSNAFFAFRFLLPEWKRWQT